ncbi:unnamed protein product [Mytilus coruscus]|uniref:Uncharacterized protein n=1 Tax=Mytilus coruscus TaxID=42192 RepID=A0A6J8ANG2_MYTCO|nr:unnamed protein product [Mytilus coruscus]
MRLVNYGDLYTLSDFSNFFEQIQNRSKEENKYDLNKITGHADAMDFWQAFDWRKIPQKNQSISQQTYQSKYPNIKIILNQGSSRKEQFLKIKVEDYIKDTGGVMAKVFEFLDVDSVDESTITKMSCRQKMYAPIFKSKVLPMFNSTKTLLRRFYEKSQVELHNLLKEYQIEMEIKPLMVNGKAIDCSK